MHPGKLTTSTCPIKNSDGTVTLRTVDITRGLKIKVTLSPGPCDENSSMSSLNGTLEIVLDGIEKRSASNGDKPLRPLPDPDDPTKPFDQKVHDDRGCFFGRWRLHSVGDPKSNIPPRLLTSGTILILLHTGTHYPPAVPGPTDSAGNTVPCEECFEKGHFEGSLTGTVVAGRHKGCHICAVLAGEAQDASGLNDNPNAPTDILFNLEGLLLCRCK